MGMELILMVTNDCNLECEYCFNKSYRVTDHLRYMSMDVVENLSYKISKLNMDVSILFTGGEPTLLNYDWFCSACGLLKKTGNIVNLKIQTNGLEFLSNPGYFLGLKDLDIDVGVSYDLFGQVARGSVDEDLWGFIKENNIPLNTVISKHNIHRLSEMYFKIKNELNIDARFIPMFRGANRDLAILEDYGDAWGEYFHTWMYDLTAIREETAEMVFSNLMGCKSIICNYFDGRYRLCVGALGEISPCLGADDSKFFMGCVCDYDSFESMYDSVAYARFIEYHRKRLDEVCSVCAIFDWCDGGCFAARSDELNICDCIGDRKRMESAYRLLREVEDVRMLNPILQRRMKRYIPVKIINNFLMNLGYGPLEYWIGDPLGCPEFKVHALLNYTSGGLLDRFISKEKVLKEYLSKSTE